MDGGDGGAQPDRVRGRLADGVSLEAARADVDGFTLRAIEATPDNRPYRYTVQRIRQVLVPGGDRVVWLVQVGALVLVLLAVARIDRSPGWPARGAGPAA